MAVKYKDIRKLENDIRRISRNEYRSAYARMVKKFPLLSLVGFKLITDENETSFEYTPKNRMFVSGESSVSTCTSEASTVESVNARPIRGFTQMHEIAYEICKSECTKKTLRELIIEKEEASAYILLQFLSERFFRGAPTLMQYGITNHPMIKYQESPNTGKGGSSKWADKSNSDVLKEIKQAAKGMRNVGILMSEDGYDNSLGLAEDCKGGCSDKLRVDGIDKLLSRQQDAGRFSQIMMDKALDNHSDFNGENVVIVYDKDAMKMRATASIYNDPFIKSNGKTVRSNREIVTSGLQIDKMDSVVVIVGA